MAQVDWDIRLEGRPWTPEELEARWPLTPEKLEVFDGKMYWTDEDRETMLAMLLENVGAARAVRLGDPSVWRKAVAALDR